MNERHKTMEVTTQMNEILANKPNDRLENADVSIKTYILKLEKKLRTTLLLENHDKEIEMTCLDLQEELFAMKLQKKESDQQLQIEEKQVQQLKVENERLNLENDRLKLEVNGLRYKLQHSVTSVPLLPQNVSSKSSSSASVTNKSASPIDKEQDQADANSVIVKGFSQNQLNKNPKVNIIRLARDMKLSISQADIADVSHMERKYYERHNLKPNKIIMIVQFQTPELKVEFLKNKEKLKLQTSTKDIEIIDYVSDEVYNLYQYAKILKSHGYVSVYWRNNCVYAKKTRSTYCEPILIKTINEVDILKVIK